MSDALFSPFEVAADAHAGYRLQYLEVFNWGTFDGQVWRLRSGAETALLTGDIGSGKSTVVDAVTTLLLPAHRISYNRAAGATAKERDLRSYVEGHYKSERVEASGRSRPIGLRTGGKTYSVVLGVFVNAGYDEQVTLAQVFQQRFEILVEQHALQILRGVEPAVHLRHRRERAEARQHVGLAGRVRPGGAVAVDFKIDRGGQVTYHGPGQVVIYLLLDLARLKIKVRELVTAIEQAVIDLLANHGVIAERRDGAPGVYVGDAKVAALGLRIRNGCSYHGVSLNVDMDLYPFTAINPCGYAGLKVTQTKDLNIPLAPQEAGEQLSQHLLRQLDKQHG